MPIDGCERKDNDETSFHEGPPSNDELTARECIRRRAVAARHG